MPNSNPVSGLPSATLTRKARFEPSLPPSSTICVQGVQGRPRIVPNDLLAPELNPGVQGTSPRLSG